MQMTSENPKHETISLAEEHVFSSKTIHIQNFITVRFYGQY